MNIIKGIDRIALILAVLAIIPGILLGSGLIYEEYKTVKPEDEAKYNEEYRTYQEKKSNVAFPQAPVKKYTHPPVWQYLIGAITGATISFALVFCIIRGLTRGIRWLALWIIAGFKDTKENKYK